MSFRLGALLLSMLALATAGSLAAAAAYAESGPFFQLRQTGTKGEEETPGEGGREEVKGEGGEQTLKGKIALIAVEIIAKSVQVKGTIYNNFAQGQANLELTYHEPKLVKPELKSCEVVLGHNDTTKVFGHLAWKWNGEKSQLQEKATKPAQAPDWLLLPTELQEGVTALPKAPLAAVVLKGSGCGAFLGTFEIEGSQAAGISPGNIEEWGTKETVRPVTGSARQHFWNGREAIGVEKTGLLLAGSEANWTGGFTFEPKGLELAVFAKVPMFVESAPGLYVISEESEAAIHEFIFKNSSGRETEKITCENTKYLYALSGPRTFLYGEPKFAEGVRSCKEAGIEVASIELSPGCIMLFEGLAMRASDEFKGRLTLMRALNQQCVMTLHSFASSCERSIKTQRLRPVKFDSLGSEVLIKIEATNLEDETNNACPEGAGRFLNNEYKGAVRVKHIVIG